MSATDALTFRVATWNIHSAVGTDGKRDVGRVADQIADLSADIVYLQEVWSGKPPLHRIGMIQSIASRLGMHYAFAPTYHRATTSYGVGILSKFPLKDQSILNLPNDKERAKRRVFREIRVALSCIVDIEGQGVKAISTHWSLEAEDRIRAAQSLNKCIQESNSLVVIGGDLNVSRDEAEVRQLLTNGGLSDADGDANTPTFPTESPQSRIDYVLLGRGLSCLKIETIACDASDHLPVVADLRVNVSQETLTL